MEARKVCLYSLIVLLLLLLCTPAHSIIYVSKSGNVLNLGTSWADTVPTIQQGVTLAALSLDPTVWVAVGTLPPPVFPLQPPAIPYVENVVVPANVAVYGGFRGDEGSASPPPARVLSTVVHPAVAATPIFTAVSVDIIDGFTIENGAAAQGAGVLCTGGTCTLSNDLIRNNTGHLGAGIFATGVSLSVTDCQFDANRVTDTVPALAAGASIYGTGGSLTVRRSTFTNERASVSTTSGDSSQGGAICFTGATLVRLDRCVFSGCVANGSQQSVLASGGAVYITGTPAEITNCVFSACAAHGQGAPQPAFGGAIYHLNPGTISIINNTFVGNAVTPQAGLITDSDRAYGLGGAIYLSGAGTSAKLCNNIIAETRGTAVVNNGMIVTFNYNLLWHNAGGDVYGFSFPSPVTDRNIMKDPQFRQADPLFHITYGSPARDTGINSGAPGFDIDGEVRPNYSGIPPPPPGSPIVDIGADEYVDTRVPHIGGADNDVPPSGVDTDLDGVDDAYDTCIATPNPNQVDSNGDGIGDVCEGIPEVFYVDAAAAAGGDGLSWATAFTTIQEGIDAADLHNQTSVDGATQWAGVNPEVWVKAGVYNENILIWHGVTVYGGFDGTEPPPSVNPDVLSGRLPLTNVSQISGGALWSTVVVAHLPQDRYLTGATKTLYHNLITTVDGFLIDNGKAEIGGGVSVYKEDADISVNRINDNTAALGGGVYFFKSIGTVGDGIGPGPGNLLTGDTTITDNIAAGPIAYAGFGGGIYTEQGEPLIFANLIQGNTAYYGGGAAARNSDPVFVENVIGCQTSPNTAAILAASGLGGGIYLDLSSNAAFEKDTIVSNAAIGVAGLGGGIYLATSDFTMDLTIMASNTAFSGQEIFAVSPLAQVVLRPLCYITQSDFWPVVAGEFFGIPDPTTGGPLPCAMTNFAVDPLFVNPAVCNYRLQAGSPLRLASGDNVGAFQDVDPPVTIGEAKKLANGITAQISGVIVTAVFPDGFYIEDVDRTSGIRVLIQNASVTEGQIVDVTGVMTTLNNERQLISAKVTATAGAAMALAPVGMTNLALGGGPVGGLTSGVSKGLSNIGLLVRTCGKVTARGTSPYPYFKIDDGSGVGVKVRVPTESCLPEMGKTVAVTGISGTETDAAGKCQRLLRSRRASDITIPQ